MNLANVMKQVGDQLDTIAGLRVFTEPPDRGSPPFAWVGYPEEYIFDETYGRGVDRIRNLPVVVAIGKAVARTTRERIGSYVNGSGSSSVKQVLESGAYSAFDGLRVASVSFDIITVAGDDVLAALFNVDIAGRGSA